MNQGADPGDDNWIDSVCPHCGNPVSFSTKWSGKPQECPTCGQVSIVPKPGVNIGAKLPVSFKTARLRHRRLLPIDLNDLLEIVGDESVTRYQDWDPYDQEDVENWLAGDQKKQLFRRGHAFFLALELWDQPKVIGYTGLTYLDRDAAEMSVEVMINPKYQRRGFGTEALRGAMQFVFVDLNVRRLCAWCDCRNSAAVGLLQKAGMRREGQFIKEKFVKGEWVDSFAYALLQEEYRST